MIIERFDKLQIDSGNEDDVKDHSDGERPVEEEFKKDFSHHKHGEILLKFFIKAPPKLFNKRQDFSNSKGTLTFANQLNNLEKVKVVEELGQHNFTMVSD